MPNPSAQPQRGQKNPGQKQRRQKKKAKTKQDQITPEMEKENVLRYLQDVFKETLDAVLIHSVLQDYNYDVEKTLETLCVLAESSASDTVNKKVPSFKDITAGLQKIKDGGDDPSSEEEDGDRDEEDSLDLNVNGATNGRDGANPSLDTWDSSIDLPLLPKPSQDNYSHPNVFKLSELQQEGKSSGVSHYNYDSYYEAEYGRKMQPQNTQQESIYETGAQIDAMLAESKKWNYYGENDSMYENQSHMMSHVYDYYGNASQIPPRNHRAGNEGMVESNPRDPTTSQGQMFRAGHADSSQHGTVNPSNLSQIGRSGQLPGQTKTKETSPYRQNNPVHRASPQNVQPKVNSSGLSQKQTNSLANKQKSQAESSLGSVSTPTWPNKKTNIVPSATQKAVSRSDHVAPLPRGKVLCLMRGLPGSGKSTLAKKLLSSEKSGVILSTDDYFMQPDGKYEFNPRALDAAHRHTQQSAKNAMRKGQTPVIIDNTNTQLWEMKPYVVCARQHHYRVEIRESNTPWKNKVGELAWRNTHMVPKEKISQMLERFEKLDSVESILKVPDKFQDAVAREKMDSRTRAKSPSPGRGRNPTHFKPKVVTQERIQTSSVPHIQQRDETPKSSRSGFTSGKEKLSSLKTTGKINSSRLAQETSKHAQQVTSQNAYQPDDTLSKEQRGNRASSTDSNLSEIQSVVTSIPLASCLQDNMNSLQAKLKGINDISAFLDENGSEEIIQSTPEQKNKDKQGMRSKTANKIEKSVPRLSGQEAHEDVTQVGMEIENEREVEGSSSPEQVTVTPYEESSVDPPHYRSNSKTVSDKRQLASADNDQNQERKSGSLGGGVSAASGDEDNSYRPKQKASCHDDQFDKYLVPSKPDDGSSEPDMELGITSLRETSKREGLLHPRDKGLGKVLDASPNFQFSEMSGTCASSEHARGTSITEDLQVVTIKEQGRAGLDSSRVSPHSLTGTKESSFIPVEKPESQQQQFEIKKVSTHYGAKVATKNIEMDENGSIKSPSNVTSKPREGVKYGKGMNVDEVTPELSNRDSIRNWDETGAKPKMKRTFSEPPILSWNPALQLPSSSPVASGLPFQSLSTVPQIKKKHRRASTPFGRRILAPSFSTSVLPSLHEPYLESSGTKSIKKSEPVKNSCLEEDKREVSSNSMLQSKEREGTMGERSQGDYAERLSFEQLSEKTVEDRKEQISEFTSSRTHVSYYLQVGEEQEKSPAVLNGTSEVSEGKPTNETTEEDTDEPKDTDPPVKRKTARHSKQKSPPLLSEETRQKALTENWSSGAITKEVLMPHVTVPSQPFAPGDPEIQHHGSQTDSSHFNLLERVNMTSENEALSEGNLRVRRVGPGVWSGTGENAAALSDSKTDDIPHRRKIDKSSMTEESKMHNPESGLDMLSSIFPHIEKEQIREVLQRCKGNAQWASEILVESNHVSTERRKREQRQNKKTAPSSSSSSQSGHSQHVHNLLKSTASSQTSRADFLFLKVTMDDTKVPEEAPNVKVLSVGEWQEVCGSGARMNQASGVGICHAETLVNLEEEMPNFDRDLSTLLQAHLDVPFMEVCEMLERNQGNAAKTEMELQRKYHEEVEESPHSGAGRGIASQEHAARRVTQHMYLSSGTHTGLSGISAGGQEDEGKVQQSSNSVTSNEPHLQKDRRNKGKPQLVRQSVAANKFIDGEQASFSDQESSYGKRGRERSERNKDSKRSNRGRSRSLPRKKPDSLVDQKLATVGGSKTQKFGKNSGTDGSKRSLSQVSVEPKNVRTQGHTRATKVKHPGTEEMYRGLPDKYNIQNLRKRVESHDDDRSSGRQQVVEGAVGYDDRLNHEGGNEDQDKTAGVDEGEQHGAEVNENQGIGQEAVAESSPSDLLNEVGKGVPKRFHQGMLFQLDMAFALQLQEIFGSVGYCIDTDVLSEDDLAIPVDLQLAKAIHTAWCVSFKQKFDREEAQLLEMMKQDEALAKKLQEEEEKMKMKEEQKRREEQYLGKNRGQQPMTYHGIPVSPAAGHQSLRDKTYSGTSALPSRGFQSSADNLRDIMDDHVAEEIGKDMQREDALSTEKANSWAVQLRRTQLKDKYPGVNQSLLEDIFMKNNFDIDPTVKELDAIVKTSEDAQNVYSEEVIQRMEEEQLKQALEKSVESQFQQVTSRRSPKTQRRLQPQAESDEPDLKKDNSFQSLEHPDYHDYRAEANLHYQQRQECFKKASDAFRRGQSQLAAYYSEEGHKHTALLKEANQRASEAILADKNKEQDDDTLDLHGLHVDEALVALETKMVEKSMRLQYSSPFIRPSLYLNIITGRGNNSKSGIAKIKPAVIKFLKTKGYRFEIMNQGMIRVKL